jgi:ubiquinone/menaquinone biosynthesis C-methylase UbiE
MFADPKRNIEQLNLTPGMRVADLGVGSGHYTFEAAKAVGASGRVYSVDIQQQLLDRIKNRARQEHLSNIDIIWGDLEKIGGTRIQESTIDVVVASNILFQLAHKDVFLEETKRILKPGGKVFIADWTDSHSGMGPAPEDVVTESAAKALLEKQGFVYERGISAGDHHYGLIYKK